MKDLVMMEGEQALTTSLKVAETFGKRHDHVIRDIRNLQIELVGIEDAPNFGEMSYFDAYNREQKGYYMDKTAFTLLVMGYTGAKAIQFKVAYIKAFDKMEEYIRNLGKSQLTTKEIALIHQLLVFFKYLDNCKHVEGLHQEMFMNSFYDYGSQESYEDLIKQFHAMRNQLLGIGNTKKIQELYKAYCLQNTQIRYNHNANKFLMLFTMDRYEFIRHAVADFLKLQLCEDSYTLKMAGEAKSVAKEARIELERTNEATLFRPKEENLINLADLKKLTTALLELDNIEGSEL
jgi:Rha family phage regulatory protein